MNDADLDISRWALTWAVKNLGVKEDLGLRDYLSAGSSR